MTRAPKPSLPASPYIDKNPQSGRRRARVTEARGLQRGTCGGAVGRGFRARARRGGESRGVQRGECSAPARAPGLQCPLPEPWHRDSPGAVSRPPRPRLLSWTSEFPWQVPTWRFSAASRPCPPAHLVGRDREAGYWAGVGVGVSVYREPL